MAGPWRNSSGLLADSLLRFEAGIEATGLVLAKDKPTWPHIPASLYGDSVFLLCVSALAA